ncbi:MAG: hypothetical protein AB4426_26295 [Xenococcaceae cyanobacterium]
MIYTASYFESNRHHGKLLSISRSIPQGFRVDGRLEFFVPSADLLRDWKKKRIGEEEYINRYREQIRANLKAIKTWLSNLDPKEDITLLCWEHSGIDETKKRWQETGEWKEQRPFCHRNLVIKLVEKFRPDCYGGTDVLNSLTSTYGNGTLVKSDRHSQNRRLTNLRQRQ